MQTIITRRSFKVQGDHVHVRSFNDEPVSSSTLFFNYRANILFLFSFFFFFPFFFPPSRQFQFLLTRQITSRPRCNFSIFNAVIGDVFLHVRPSVHVSWEHFGQASLCLDIDCVVRAYYTGAHAKLRFQVSGHGNYAQRYVQRATSNAGSEESFFRERERFDIFLSLREKGKNQERIFCYFSVKSNFFFFKSIRFVPVSEAVSRNFKID